MKEKTALFHLQPLKLHELWSQLLHFFVRLKGILAILLAHLADILVLHRQHFKLFLHAFHLLLVVPIHLQGEVSRSVDGIWTLLHKNDLLLQLLYFSFVLVQFLNCSLATFLRVSLFLCAVCWWIMLLMRSRVLKLRTLSHQFLNHYGLMIQLRLFVLTLLLQLGIDFGELVDLLQ